MDGKNGAGSARAGARHSRGPARRPHDQKLRLPLSFIVALAPSFYRSFLQIPGACALRRHPRCRKIRRSRISRCGRSRSSSRALTPPEGEFVNVDWNPDVLIVVCSAGTSMISLIIPPKVRPIASDQSRKDVQSIRICIYRIKSPESLQC